MFLDSTQTPVVFLTDTTRLAAVEQAGVDASLTSRGKSTASIRVRQAPYNFLQLKRWRDSASNALAGAGPTTYGIDKAHNRLHVGVVDSTARQTVETKLRELGIPLAAVEIKIEKPVAPSDGHLNETVKDSVRPLREGIFIEYAVNGLFGKCTLGFVMKQNGSLYFVTASHCSTSQGSVDGTEYYQNYYYDGNDKIGKEVRDPAYSDGWNSYAGESCPTGWPFHHYYCRVSDANVDSIYPEFGGTIMKGLIARTQSPGRGLTAGSLFLDLNSPGLFIRGYASSSPMVGDSVWKTGWRTGTTGGTITAVCYDVGYTNEAGTDIKLLCQDAVAAWDRPGDSGSPVYSWDRASGDSTVILQGILFANDDADDDGDMSASYFSPWNFIVDELGTMDPVADSLHFQNDLEAWISGAATIEFPDTYTYFANVTGGTGTYSYRWQYQDEGSSTWNSLGTGQSQTIYRSGAPSFTMQVTATSASRSKTPTYGVYWNPVSAVWITQIQTTCGWSGGPYGGTPPYYYTWTSDGGPPQPVKADTTMNPADSMFSPMNTTGNLSTIYLTVADAAGSSAYNQAFVPSDCQ